MSGEQASKRLKTQILDRELYSIVNSVLHHNQSRITLNKCISQQQGKRERERKRV